MNTIPDCKPFKATIFLYACIAGCALLAIAGINAQAGEMSGPQPQVSTESDPTNGRFMFNVTLHTPEEIEGMLDRAKKLSQTTRPTADQPGIALILHGTEIELFDKKNYKKYKKIVDQAATLDADNIIDIKICRTQMRSMGIKETDLPAFIEIVPYGPAEEEKLRRNGYIYL